MIMRMAVMIVIVRVTVVVMIMRVTVVVCRRFFVRTDGRFRLALRLLLREGCFGRAIDLPQRATHRPGEFGAGLEFGTERGRLRRTPGDLAQYGTKRRHHRMC